MSDLRALVEAVEAGTATMNDFAKVFPSETAFGATTWGTAHNAFSGSLQAAVTLTAHILPGWSWTVDSKNCASVYSKGTICANFSANPARALLLAALRAKLKEGE